MAEPFLGEIRTFAFDYAPQNWAICDGRLLSINQNQALFSLLGTYYGGDGVNNFGLPDLQGRVARHKSAADSYGQKFGVETVVVTENCMPAHSHQFNVKSADPTTNDPTNNVLGTAAMYAAPNNSVNMSPNTLAPSPGAAHNNLQPSLVINYCIALTGIFPSRP
jgi:microcystin-dependent protein